MLMVLAGRGPAAECGRGVLSATEKLTQKFVVGNILQFAVVQDKTWYCRNRRNIQGQRRLLYYCFWRWTHAFLMKMEKNMYVARINAVSEPYSPLKHVLIIPYIYMSPLLDKIVPGVCSFDLHVQPFSLDRVRMLVCFLGSPLLYSCEYHSVWTPRIGEQLVVMQESHNTFDRQDSCTIWLSTKGEYRVTSPILTIDDHH